MAKSITNKNQNSTSEPTELSVQGQGWRLSIVGSALAVIALIAVIGVIWIASKALDISARAIPTRDIEADSSISAPP